MYQSENPFKDVIELFGQVILTKYPLQMVATKLRYLISRKIQVDFLTNFILLACSWKETINELQVIDKNSQKYFAIANYRLSYHFEVTFRDVFKTL